MIPHDSEPAWRRLQTACAFQLDFDEFDAGWSELKRSPQVQNSSSLIWQRNRYQDPFHISYNPFPIHVFPLRRAPPAFVGGKDRGGRNRGGDGVRHVYPVRCLDSPMQVIIQLSTVSSLTQSCTKKCIPSDYREGDLNKGESVCLDRCVSKFFEVNVKVSEKMQGEAAGRQGPTGQGGFGM